MKDLYFSSESGVQYKLHYQNNVHRITIFYKSSFDKIDYEGSWVFNLNNEKLEMVKNSKYFEQDFKNFFERIYKLLIFS